MNLPLEPPTYQSLAHYAPLEPFKLVNGSLSDGLTAISYPLYPKYSTTFDPAYITNYGIDARPVVKSSHILTNAASIPLTVPIF